MKHNIVAIVPMRNSSERIPGKNYRLFCGKPLYHYIIESLIDCSLISEVVIDTDSDTIINESSIKYPDVIIVNRPEHLCDGSLPMNSVLQNTISVVHADFYLQTHSTNPLLKTNTIEKALQMFLDNYPVYDSLFSVTKIQTRLWDSLGRAVNHNPNILLRTQDLLPVYEENSCMYIFSAKTLRERYNRIGDRPLIFEMDRIESTDIDEEEDFVIAELLYQAKNR
jgi:CMP-N-acetylneuraminic acid synthetase